MIAAMGFSFSNQLRGVADDTLRLWPWGPLGMGLGLPGEKDGENGERPQFRGQSGDLGPDLGGFTAPGSKLVGNSGSQSETQPNGE